MAKRKLSLQQKRRITANQGQKAIVLDGATDPSLGPELAGIIITRFGKRADVLSPDFSPQDRPQRCHIRANITDLVTGDDVIWRQGENSCVVEKVLPRRSVLSRPDNRGQLRPVAANVDRIAIVIAPEPSPHSNLIDRYLVAAENQHITPLLLINKTDLSEYGDLLCQLEQAYRALGYDVLRLSARTGIGMDDLRHYLQSHTTVLVGQSGVGKSSIVNQLQPSAGAAVGELSEQVAKGRHTTTAATFYRLPDGGHLVDSPGIREFGLWHLDWRSVASGFREFSPYLGTCRFRDCLHRDEPGCAILAALKKGLISTERHQSYQHILQELSAGQ